MTNDQISPPITNHNIATYCGLLAFVILATANGGGYRYGISDQAFYIPAVLHALEPGAFPRDASLIDAQAHLMVLDEAFAGVMRVTGLSLPVLFAAGYFLSLTLIWAALVLIGRRVYVQGWTVVALLAALTLRHQITRTSANTLEPYFHPRMLAFGICALAVAAVLHRRPWLAIAMVAAGATVHPTTALWFAVLIGVAIAVSERRLRPFIVAGAAAAVAVAVWMVTKGPLAHSLTIIDSEWRQVLASKTSLFASQWPFTAWVANLGTAAVWAWSYLERRKRGIATPEDAGLAAGGAGLLLLFLITLPCVAAGVALFVELQISRVFWIVDVMATVYVLAAIERLPGPQPGVVPRALRLVAFVLIAFSVGRGVFVLWVERPERRLFAFQLEDSPWHDAMRWIASQPLDVHVLADPGHAWKYGTSVRVSGERDVFLEDVKDSAIAIYSRDVAMRVRERIEAVGDFERLDTERAGRLAARYDFTYLVTTASLPLPVRYRNAQFTIYALR
jgi:hypothetical protein